MPRTDHDVCGPRDQPHFRLIAPISTAMKSRRSSASRVSRSGTEMASAPFLRATGNPASVRLSTSRQVCHVLRLALLDAIEIAPLGLELRADMTRACSMAPLRALLNGTAARPCACRRAMHARRNLARRARARRHRDQEAGRVPRRSSADGGRRQSRSGARAHPAARASDARGPRSPRHHRRTRDDPRALGRAGPLCVHRQALRPGTDLRRRRDLSDGSGLRARSRPGTRGLECWLRLQRGGLRAAVGREETASAVARRSRRLDAGQGAVATRVSRETARKLERAKGIEPSTLTLAT